MSHWRIYPPIPRVSSYLDGIASLEDLQVTACTAPSPAPVSIGCYSLSIAQVDALVVLLLQAKADVQAGVTQDPPEVTCG